MNLGAAAGLTGLAKSVDRVGESQRTLQTLENLDTKLKQDANQNMMMQELEAKQYEEIQAKASELLEPDRIKIKAEARKLQQNIRSKIEEYGSRKAFFENGGVALLSKYKSDLLTSSQTLNYMDNKKNMEKLMAIQEAGKGGLLSTIDLQNLNDYQQGVGTGKITYSGLKSEVDMGLEKQFDYQEDIPAHNILHYKNNYLSIYGNWMKDNPSLKHLQGQELEDELLTYTYNNHKTLGTNEVNRNMRMAQRARQQEEKAAKASGTTDQKIPPVSFVASMNKFMNQAKSNNKLSISSLSEGNQITEIARTDPAISALFGSKGREYIDVNSEFVHENQNVLSKLGDIALKATGLDNKYTLASAYKVPIKSIAGVKESLYGKPNADGTINAHSLNQSDYYSANGERLSKEDIDIALEAKDNQNMVFNGLVYAFVDDNDKIITNVLDSKGQRFGQKDKSGKYTLADEDKDHMKAYAGTPKHDMFAVLKTADGNTIFHRVYADDVIGETELSKAIGSVDNIAPSVQQRKMDDVQEAQNIQKVEIDKKLIQQEVNLASQSGGVFSSPEYVNEARRVRVADGSNRDNLIKAYYLAMADKATGGQVSADNLNKLGFQKQYNPNNFTKKSSETAELRNALLNHNKVNDVDYIKMFADIHTNGVEEDAADNNEFAYTWTQYLKLLTK
jgi:hypothetical protein